MTLKEAWNGLLERIKNYAEIFEDKEEQQIILKQLDIIRPHLVPPTADEVCKALGEWIDENPMVAYGEVYYDDKKKSFEVGQYEPSICYKDDEVIWFNWFRLPSHLITLIGRFYEGIENENTSK